MNSATDLRRCVSRDLEVVVIKGRFTGAEHVEVTNEISLFEQIFWDDMKKLGELMRMRMKGGGEEEEVSN